MKEAEKDQPVNTIPNGVWESSRPENSQEDKNKCTITTDLQGNGYPAKQGR